MTSRLAPVIADRFSPVRFDPAHVVGDDDVDSLLDAARLARHLARSSGAWAPAASLLLANLAQLQVEGSDLEYSEFAHYDLGQALAHLTVQAHHLGLAVHQFRAFDRAALAAELTVPPYWQVTTMAAVGLPVGPAHTHTCSGTSREGRSRAEVTWLRAGPVA